MKNIIITSIKTPITVYTSKSHSFEMKNRPTYGIAFCAEGSICYYHNGKKYISDKTCAVILPKGQSYKLKGQEEGVFYLIDFECESYYSNEFMLLPIQNPQMLIAYAQQIQKLLVFKENRLKAFGVFYEMLSTIALQAGQSHNILHPAIKYLEENLCDSSVTNSVLAQKANISEVYFRKLFIQQYGVSPKQYIIEKRIDYAKLLLINSPYSVTAVALDCGFSSVYLFCRTFKAKTGLTPTQYIKQNKIAGI